MKFERWGRVARAAMLMAVVALPAAGSSILERLHEPYLSALRVDARKVRRAAMPSERSGEFLDVRCALHAHSGLSHDSRITPEQVVEAAKKAKVRAMFMTEHPTPDRKWSTEGMRGEKEGVLFVPGAELNDGLLVWRGEAAQWTPNMKAGEVLEKLQGTDGVAFIAHPEMRKTDVEWELPPFAGMEIYNSHADAMDSDYEKALGGLRTESPLKIMQMLNTVKRFERESYAAIFDEQKDTVARWDRLNQAALGTGRRVVGIAGNDAHQNVGITVESGAEGLILKDALGKKVGDIPRKNVPFLFAGLAPGTTVLSQLFDPYAISLGYVSTHVLAPEVSEQALFDALLRGRAYVAFDWMGDPSGFRFTAAAGERTVEMGSDVPAADRPVLTVRPNMASEIRLLRNGEEVQKTEGEELVFQVSEPGVYRAEVWVAVGEGKRPWIYTNPIYVTP